MNKQITAPPQVLLPVFTIDSNWEITFFSKAAEDLLQVKASDTIGMKCHNFFSNHDQLSDFINLCSTIASGKSMASFPMVLKNSAIGQNPAFIVAAIPVPDKTGNLAGAIVSFQETPNHSWSTSWCSTHWLTVYLPLISTGRSLLSTGRQKPSPAGPWKKLLWQILSGNFSLKCLWRLVPSCQERP